MVVEARLIGWVLIEVTSDDNAKIQEAWNYVKHYHPGMSDVDIIANDTSDDTWQVYLAYLTTLPLETRQKEWNDFKKTINMLEVLEIDEEVTVIQHSALNIEFIDNLGNKLAERQTSPKLGYDKWWKKFHDLAFSKG